MAKFTADESGMAELVKTIKEKLRLKDGDAVTAQMNAQCLVLKKDGNFCFLCGSDDELYITGKKICMCGDCLRAMQKAVKA